MLESPNFRSESLIEMIRSRLQVCRNCRGWVLRDAHPFEVISRESSRKSPPDSPTEEPKGSMGRFARSRGAPSDSTAQPSPSHSSSSAAQESHCSPCPDDDSASTKPAGGPKNSESNFHLSSLFSAPRNHFPGSFRHDISVPTSGERMLELEHLLRSKHPVEFDLSR